VHPNANLDEARKVLADGEPVYNQKKLQEAKYWIRSHPKQFFSLSALRLAAFGFHQLLNEHIRWWGPVED